MKMPTLATLPDGRIAGRFIKRPDGRTILRKAVDVNRHMLQKPPAFAISTTHLQQLIDLGGKEIELIARDGRVFRATVETFLRHGFLIKRDIDEQRALPLAFWHVDAPNVRQLTLFDPCDS